MVCLRTSVMTLAALLAAAPAYAVDWTIGLGAGYLPDYEGSEDYQPVPFWNLRASNLYGPTTYVDILATKLTSNLVAHPNLRFGPMVEFIPERDDVENDAVDDLPSAPTHLTLRFRTHLVLDTGVLSLSVFTDKNLQVSNDPL